MKKISIMIMVLVVALASCKKTPEVNLKYVDVERDLVTVGSTTANIQCDYEYIATLKKAYLFYGEGENENAFTSAEMRVVQNTLYVELTGLRENTTYSYYYEFHNGFNSMRTAVKTFKTKGSDVTITLPTVVTAEVTEITSNSAKGGGEVTNDGGAEVTERGICWSPTSNPTVDGSHMTAGTGTGVFTAMMNGLEANTTYHVRAYATNEVGTAYGLDREFVALSNAPQGAINGLFTINENGDLVYFSQGNLQYQASTNTWRFAENQWDYVGAQSTTEGNPGGTVDGSDNNFISSTYSGWIDLFGWGTSGYNHGAECYQPWSTDRTNDYYYAYGCETCNLYDQTGQADWGYNAISNGGNTENSGWRALTKSEWDYIFNTRNTTSGIRYAKARVNRVHGVILLPDNWSVSTYNLSDTNQIGASFGNNVISASQWNSLQNAGAVFLPAAGFRQGTSVYNPNFRGNYWSASSSYDSSRAYTAYFTVTSLGTSSGSGGSFRNSGQSVRLVCPGE